MINTEYIAKLSQIRILINTLCDDIGATYNSYPYVLENVLNDAMNGDFTSSGTELTTNKIIYVNKRG